MPVTDPVRIRELAQEKEKENWRFRARLKRSDLLSDELDAIVHRLTAEVSSKIDCNLCRNCCRELGAALDAAEITRMAQAEHLTPAEFKREYLGEHSADRKLVVRQRPCPFLSGNACRHHDIRPRACVEFPHLHKPEFRTRLITVVFNTWVCPIVYNVYELLKYEVAEIEMLRRDASRDTE